GRIWAQAGCGLYATVSKLDGKHFHRAWVQSLVWRRVHGSDAPFIAAGEGLGLEFPPLSSTEIDEELLRLIALWWRGRSRPVPMFARASLAFASARASGKSSEQALLTASKDFRSQ